MAIQPLHPVRNTQTGPLSESLEIAYDFRRATVTSSTTDKTIPNLGLGFGDSSLWDGTPTHNGFPATLEEHAEGILINLQSGSRQDIVASTDTSMEFPQGSFMVRFAVDSAGVKANFVNSGDNITTGRTFLINVTTGANLFKVRMSDSTGATEYRNSWNSFVTGQFYTAIVTWGANGVKSFLDGTEPEIDNSTGTPTTGFIVGSGASEYRIGRNNLNAPTSSRILAVYQWSKELTPTQITALFADPYLSIRQSVKATLPLGTRGTQLNTDSIAGATKTQWEITGDATFTHTTTATSGAFGSVLSSDLNHLNMWLPPFHNYLARVRQLVGGSWGEWTPFISFASRGPVNSFENYSILNANTVTIP